MAAYSGFPEESFDTVFIILDKMDKIGLDGVAAELKECGFSEESINKYMDLFRGLETAQDGLGYLAGKLEGVLEAEVVNNLREISDSVSATRQRILKWYSILRW